jgi:hypothetical protein
LLQVESKGGAVLALLHCSIVPLRQEGKRLDDVD